MSGWDEWLSCEGECIDNQIEGYQTRFRHHMVNNQPVELIVRINFKNGYKKKYNVLCKYSVLYLISKHFQGPLSKRIPKDCIEKYSVTELRACTDSCDDEDNEGIVL